MPFLHCSKKNVSWFKRAEEQSFRTGWRCKIFRPQGGYYKGDWKKSYKCGKGVQLLPSGFQYEGDWLCNNKDGFGVLSKYDAKERIFHLVYLGDYRENKKHGCGSFHYKDGTFYEGEFKCNKRHGFGKCWFADGSYYEGYWKNDLQHGYGMFVQANGNRYEGEWHNGMKDGFGEYYHLSTSQKQVGLWENEICVMSFMEDLKFRQSAVTPTPYPIPISQLHPEAPCLIFLENVEKTIKGHNKNCQPHKFYEKDSTEKMG